MISTAQSLKQYDVLEIAIKHMFSEFFNKEEPFGDIENSVKRE